MSIFAMLVLMLAIYICYEQVCKHIDKRTAELKRLIERAHGLPVTAGEELEPETMRPVEEAEPQYAIVTPPPAARPTQTQDDNDNDDGYTSRFDY